jgi:hypothetical protein
MLLFWGKCFQTLEVKKTADEANPKEGKVTKDVNNAFNELYELLIDFLK